MFLSAEIILSIQSVKHIPVDLPSLDSTVARQMVVVAGVVAVAVVVVLGAAVEQLVLLDCRSSSSATS